MLLLLLATTSLPAVAGSSACDLVERADLATLPAPRVIVLGERRGHQPDLARARRLVGALSHRAEVTLAVDAVHKRYQRELDRVANGELAIEDLEAAVAKGSPVAGFPFAPYARLLEVDGVDLIAAGVDLTAPSVDEPVPVPADYGDLLLAGMDPVAPDVAEGIARAMAWTDYRIAEAAVTGWSGRGYLVIVTDRARVEGGKGVSWQVQRMSGSDVTRVALAYADPPCFEGDKVWTPGRLRLELPTLSLFR